MWTLSNLTRVLAPLIEDPCTINHIIEQSESSSALPCKNPEECWDYINLIIFFLVIDLSY